MGFVLPLYKQKRFGGEKQHRNTYVVLCFSMNSISIINPRKVKYLPADRRQQPSQT